MTEREVKLRYESPAIARHAVMKAGAIPLRPRRLQNDYLLDREATPLRIHKCALRVRFDGNDSILTFKGPPQPGRTKMREELETSVADGELLLTLFQRLGYHVWFRYQKYREEFRLGNLVITIDESPIGTFVELEGAESEILDMADALGRPASTFVLDSYFALFLEHRKATGSTASHMLFETS